MVDQIKSPESTNDRGNELNTVQIQLRSQRASDILRGMSQVRRWLQENVDDRQVYEVLLDAVQENHEIREQVRNLLLEKIQKGSRGAEEALSILPSTPQDLLTDADDAYYAAEYDRAIQLYLQVLKRVPDHGRAMEYLGKAKSAQQNAGDLTEGLPRDAVQHYRRARSYMPARDFLSAIKSLSAAVEAAQERGIKYIDAEELLKSAQESLIADEFKQKGNRALEKEQWESALEFINKGLGLNLADEVIKAELNCMQELVRAEMKFQKWGAFKIFKALGELRRAQMLAKGTVSPDNFLLNLVGKQLNQIGLIRGAGLIVLLVAAFALSSYFSGKVPASPAPLETPTISAIHTVKPLATSTDLPAVTVTQTNIVLTTESPTETLEPLPTATALLGYGKLTANIFPIGELSGDAKSTEILLYRKQFVAIVDSKYFQEAIWYKCIWDVDGVSGVGWINGKYIEFGPPPTPKP